MAFVNAIGPNYAPDPVNAYEPDSLTGDVTTATFAKDEEVPDDLEDDDDNIVQRKRAGRINELDNDEKDDLEDDLFGDGADDELREEAEELAEPKERRLDDEELDSGDDEGRADRAASEQQAEEETRRDEVIQFPDFDRQALPEPTDGEMYLLKIPKFMAIDPTMFNTSTFQVPINEHHSRKEVPASFSAYNTAMSTVRWRHSPSNPDDIQSNARILRWSDGTLTLQHASDPTQQFEIDGNALAPPQRNPAKPTPTSLKPGQRERPGQETYTYLTIPHASVGLLRVTQRITAGLSILPSDTSTDDALEKLQNSLAAAVQKKSGNKGGSIELVKISEDPELAKKKAEVAERDKLRAQKRREAAETRDRERGSRALGRAGLSRGYGAGLSASMLEDDEMGGATKPRAKPKASRRAYNDEYDSDEDLGRRRGNFANDDYEVDDFVAGSDEEEEEAEAESDEEDIDDGIREQPRKRSPKRERAREEEDEDADGADDDDVVQAPKGKRRRAVVDEDDDE